ncbi:MAG: MmgE/PrpD family protein [Sphingomonas bacterium]
MTTMVEKFARLARETRFADLPDEAVSEAGRIMLDSIGVAVAAIYELKGKAGIDYGRLIGGPAGHGDATIMGTGDRVSVFGAAFANGELINTLDMDAVMPPGHITPYVLPGIMALGESLARDGKSVIEAIAVSHEISCRIGMGMDYLRDTKDGKVDPPPVFGYAETIFGATAAIGMLRGHSAETLANGLGIAGSVSPVNSQVAWFQHAPSSTIKYLHAGVLTQSAFTAAYAAELGHRGDIRILDDAEFGYRRFIGTRRWFADSMVENLGSEWRFPALSTFKPYPHCRILHALIDEMTEILDANAIGVEEIDGIKVYVEGMVEQPVWLNRDILLPHDAQFSIAHGIAVGAHRVQPGRGWMDPDLIFGPSVMGLMDKVTHEVHPDYVKLLSGNAASRPARLEIQARSRTFAGERRYPKGSKSPDPESFMTDEQLIAKFLRNADGILPRANAERIVELTMDMANVADVGEIMRLTAPMAQAAVGRSEAATA